MRKPMTGSELNLCWSTVQLRNPWITGALHAPPSVEQVDNGQPRMAEQHPWPGKAHDMSDFLPHGWPVAVNGTLRAYGFLFAKFALVQPQPGVVKNLATSLAEAAFRPVFLPAVEVNHSRHGFLLIQDSVAPQCDQSPHTVWRPSGRAEFRCASDYRALGRGSCSLGFINAISPRTPIFEKSRGARKGAPRINRSGTMTYWLVRLVLT